MVRYFEPETLNFRGEDVVTTTTLAQASVSNANTYPDKVINDEYETVKTPNPNTGVQRVEESLIGTQYPQYVEAEVTQTGVIIPPNMTLSGSEFQAFAAQDYTPTQTITMTAGAGATTTGGSVENFNAANFVKENGFMIGAVAVILGVGYFSARGVK